MNGSGDGRLASWGLSWATCSGLIYWGLREMANRGSGGGAFSLYGSSVKGTWREGSLAGDPGG